MLDGVDALLDELLLFAGAGFLIAGLDDLLLDLTWLLRRSWLRLVVYRRHAPASMATLPLPCHPGRIAVMIAAWDESRVIGAMLREALARIDHPDFRLYVGTYPNDPATTAVVAEIAAADMRVRPVVGPLPGRTTKGDNLNHVWAALVADEAESGQRFKAVVLHDAEDLIHRDELRLFDAMIERFDVVQIPVLPVPRSSSQWISGHYCDEFAEAHHRHLPAREILGAGVPLAGVGCAIARDAIGRIADANDGRPFDPASLTEDYEIGLRLAELGYRGAFVSLPVAPGEAPVMVRALFPDRLGAAVRQKTRWMIGIALAGWDRLGWSGSLVERWMRLRDRRALLAALVLLVAYLALLLWAASRIGHFATGTPPMRLTPGLALLLGLNFLLFLWRSLMRWVSVRCFYGSVQAWRAVARIPISNAIAMLSARRAVGEYWRHLRGQPLRWAKTAHDFPDAMPAE